MSRKRKQRSKAQAVPEEVLAEGSGPVGPAPEAQTESPDVIVESTDDSFEETILPAAADVQDAPGDEPLEAASDEPTDEAIGEAIEDPVDDPTDGSVERAAEAASDDAVEPMQMVPDETIEVVDLIDPVDGADEPVATLPTSAGSMDAAQLKLLVEALVFASDKPITVARLRQLTRVSDTKRLEQALAELTQDYGSRGLVLQQVSGGYQFRTRSQFSGWVQQLIAGRPVRLSRAQLETLAIIAYRQPITRPEIDDIRGVDSSGTLKVLIDRALIRILGKKEEVGRPMLYGTTRSSSTSSASATCESCPRCASTRS
ncbi:MAG: SMC-Scp complex subunit ScpB [Kofleriaceae bacterium]